MNADDVKIVISKRTGIPITLLTGETVEEDIAKAKALLAYKQEADAKRPKTAKEQFVEWADGAEDPGTETNPFKDLEDAAYYEAGGYPKIQDGGEVTGLPDGRTPAEQFSEWASKQFAYDPFRQGIWHKIL